MKHMIGALAVVVSTAAFGQQTTTNCTTSSWGSVQCVSNTPQPPQGGDWAKGIKQYDAGGAFNDAFQKGLRDQAAREAMQQQAMAARAEADAAAAQANAAQAQAQNAEAARLSDEQHKAQSLEAAMMVTAGNCEGAQHYALSVGNFVLAKQVKDYCGK